MNRYQQYMYSYPHKTAYGPLEGLRLDDYKSRLEASNANSLYFHLPFCETKCGYCNLFSLAGQPSAMIKDYLTAMEQQLKQYALDKVMFQDFTIGGGTPLYLSAQDLERMFGVAEDWVHFSSAQPEIIIETSPRQTTADKVRVLKDHGVTRVSMGVQSFHDQELQTLGRLHRLADIQLALSLLKEAGFPCLNLDLIYGVPGQTAVSVLDSLKQVLAYEPEEIFLYPLYIKPGTGLFRQGQQVSEEAYSSYCLLREHLLAHGYGQTSMRRFIRGGLVEDETWQGCGFHEYTLSIGCGGRSYIDELHFCAPYSVQRDGCAQVLQTYLQTVDHQAITYGYLLSDDERKRRFILKNLFFFRGLPLSQYKALFSCSPLEDFSELEHWLEAGWIYQDTKGNLQLSKMGMDLSDYLGPKLISPAVRAKMEAWHDV